MGTKGIFGVVGFGLAALLFAEPASVEWKDGERAYKAYLVPGLVAHFHPQRTERSRFGKNLAAKTEIELPAATIFSVPSAKYRQVFSSAPDRFQSPVFSDAPRGGNLRSLPGGVLLTFSEGTDVGKWAELNQRKFVRQIGKGPTWLVETPPGLTGLETARALGEDPAVLSSTPNWWIHLEPRKAPPSSAEAARLRRSWNSSKP